MLPSNAARQIISSRWDALIQKDRRKLTDGIAISQQSIIDMELMFANTAAPRD